MEHNGSTPTAALVLSLISEPEVPTHRQGQADELSHRADELLSCAPAPVPAAVSAEKNGMPVKVTDLAPSWPRPALQVEEDLPKVLDPGHLRGHDRPDEAQNMASLMQELFPELVEPCRAGWQDDVPGRQDGPAAPMKGLFPIVFPLLMRDDAQGHAGHAAAVPARSHAGLHEGADAGADAPAMGNLLPHLCRSRALIASAVDYLSSVPQHRTARAGAGRRTARAARPLPWRPGGVTPAAYRFLWTRIW